MITLRDNFEISLDYPTYIALGSFDGLHYGHMNLIKEVVEKAKINNCKSLLYTFDNHPLSVVNPEKEPKHLMTNNEKLMILESYGIDIVNFATFTEEYMKIQPEEFIENLVNKYNMKGIVVGFNNRFGYKNRGDINLLKELGEKLNFEIIVVEEIKLGNEAVSSTKIRHYIETGIVEKANFLLQRPYSLSGSIIHGRKLGRTIGFPTANIHIDNKILLPKSGVYYTNTKYEDKIYKSITNIGYNPTVNGNNLTVETYILNFDKEIYDNVIDVYFIKYLRDEQKFSSLEELIKVLENDKKFAEKQILMPLF